LIPADSGFAARDHSAFCQKWRDNQDEVLPVPPLPLPPSGMLREAKPLACSSMN